MALYMITKRHRASGDVLEVNRKRVDAARLMLRKLTYEALKAGAYLDTRHGHEAMELAENIEQGQGFNAGGYMLCMWRVD